MVCSQIQYVCTIDMQQVINILTMSYVHTFNSIHKCLAIYLEEFLARKHFFLQIIIMHDIILIMTTTMTAPIIIGSRFELEEDDSIL